MAVDAAETLKTGVKIYNSKKGVCVVLFCGGVQPTKRELWGKNALHHGFFSGHPVFLVFHC